MTEEPDYITLNPVALGAYKFNVVIMRYSKTGDEYVVYRISDALPEKAAKALAQMWAAAMGGLEIR